MQYRYKLIRTATGSHSVHFTVVTFVSKIIYRHDRAFGFHRRVKSADSSGHWVGDRYECVRTLRVLRTGHLTRENNVSAHYISALNRQKPLHSNKLVVFYDALILIYCEKLLKTGFDSDKSVTGSFKMIKK